MDKAGKIIKWLSPNDEANEGMLSELWLRKLGDVVDSMNKTQSKGYYDEAIKHIEEAIRIIQVGKS